jgi:hypothetical protein
MEIYQGIKKNFPKVKTAININIVPQKKDSIQNAPGASGIDNGQPTIDFYVGFWREIEQELNRSFGSEASEVFQTTVAISFMHEAEHLLQMKTGMEDKQATIEEEDIAWANTCKYAIDPLAKMGKKMASSQMRFYQAWNMAGRDRKNQTWKDFIRSDYKNLPGYKK